MSKQKLFTHFTIGAALILGIFRSGLMAQDSTRLLSLDEAIQNTLSNNATLKMAGLDVSIASANYKQTEAIYLPQLALSYTGMSTNNPLNAFGFKLQQQSITANDFNPALLNHPGGTANFNTQLELQQPILNMDLLYQRKGAEKQVEVYQFKNQRTREYLRFETQKAYLQLHFSYSAKKVLEEALATAKAVYTSTHNHYLQGLIQQSDVLNVQVQVSGIESKLAKAKSMIRNASDYLSVLMGMPTGTVYTTMLAAPDTGATTENLQAVPDNRADFMAMKKAIEASDLMIESGKKSYLPRVNAFGSYQLNDNRVAGFGAGAYLAGVRVSWDIFKGNTTKNSIARQTLEKNKLSVALTQQKEESNQALAKTKRDISDIGFEISQHKASIQQATEALRILQNRYEQGLVTTTDVMMAATQLAEQKFNLTQSEFNRQVNQAFLQLLTTSSK